MSRIPKACIPKATAMPPANLQGNDEIIDREKHKVFLGEVVPNIVLRLNERYDQ
eukprot:m.86446 g.86446  ORF g.86446 m.86446 type:complete len:54 (+) comp12810_c0_seq1:1490-1651(+)